MIPGRSRSDRACFAFVLAGCLLQIALGTALAYTTLPLCDEGFYGVPAHVLSVTGVLRNPVLESAGLKYLRGIDRALYWMAPGGVVIQAMAFKIFGFGLLVQRGVSVICGLGAVLLWYSALRRLVSEKVAAVAAILLPADYLFLSLSCLGRADMISLFFAMAALAGYMRWRERNMVLAVAIGTAACALSGVVHPNGGIAGAVSLAVMAWYLDRKRLAWVHFAVAAACGLLAVAAWGIYIARAPDLFVAQFFGNVANRLGGGMTLTRLLGGELTRYLGAWGLLNASGLKWLRLLLPVSYLAAILFCVLSRDLRRQAGILLWMFAGVSLTLVFLEGAKQGFYLVHLTPLFSVFLAICLTRLWDIGRTLPRAIFCVQVAVVLLGVSSLVYSLSSRHLQRLYQPVVTFLNARVVPQNLVMAPSQFYFGLQCRTCLRDDAYLGAFSGRRADYIVLDKDYDDSLSTLRVADPSAYGRTEDRIRVEYREVFRNVNYRVLQRTAIGF